MIQKDFRTFSGRLPCALCGTPGKGDYVEPSAFWSLSEDEKFATHVNDFVQRNKPKDRLEEWCHEVAKRFQVSEARVREIAGVAK